MIFRYIYSLLHIIRFGNTELCIRTVIFFSTRAFGHLPKPEVCWSGRGYELCVELIITVNAQRDWHLSLGSCNLEP